MQTFAVTGIADQHAVGTLTEAIKRVDPDASPEFDLATGRLVVTNDTAPEDVLLQAIEAEGFAATPVLD